jgi:hypothetical protein
MSRNITLRKWLLLHQNDKEKDRVLEIKSIAVQMIEGGSNDSTPSPRQIAFAQFLGDKKGLKLSQEILTSSKKLSEWLNRNKNKRDS